VLHLLRHHTHIRLVAAVVGEAVEAEAIIEVPKQHDVMLERDVGPPATAAPAATAEASATATAHSHAAASNARACAATDVQAARRPHTVSRCAVRRTVCRSVSLGRPVCRSAILSRTVCRLVSLRRTVSHIWPLIATERRSRGGANAGAGGNGPRVTAAQ